MIGGGRAWQLLQRLSSIARRNGAYRRTFLHSSFIIGNIVIIIIIIINEFHRDASLTKTSGPLRQYIDDFIHQTQ